MKKIIESLLYIIVGVFILIFVQLHLVEFAEFITIILEFIGFAAVLNGIFGIYIAFTQKEKIR